MLYKLLINKLGKAFIINKTCLLNLSLYNNKKNAILCK